MPLVFAALVIWLIFHSIHEDNKNQKKIKRNEESKRRAHVEDLKKWGVSTAKTCARDELRIAQAMIKKGLTLSDAIIIARAEIENMGLTPCLSERDFYNFNFDATIPEEFVSNRDGEHRREEVRLYLVDKRGEQSVKASARKWNKKEVYVNGQGYGRVKNVEVKLRHDYKARYEDRYDVWCKVRMLSGDMIEAWSSELTEVKKQL